MKTALHSYTFNSAGKAIAVTDPRITRLQLERLVLIVDTTVNRILYNFADSTIGTATVTGRTITFTASAAGLADTDSLIIYYDVDCPPGADPDSLIVLLLSAVITRLDMIAAYIDSRYDPPDEFGLGSD